MTDKTVRKVIKLLEAIVGQKTAHKDCCMHGDEVLFSTTECTCDLRLAAEALKALKDDDAYVVRSCH